MGIYGNYLMEGFFKKKKEAIPPSKSDYNKVVTKTKELLNKYPKVKKLCKICPFKIDGNAVYFLSYNANKLEYYNDLEEFNNDFDKMIIELIKSIKEDKSIKIYVDGDEFSGSAYIEKYKI